jgi:hypothetical protein
MYEKEQLNTELQQLRDEHVKLDRYIAEHDSSTMLDRFVIQRMKKRKLWLKDKILGLEAMLYPDIIA